MGVLGITSDANGRVSIEYNLLSRVMSYDEHLDQPSTWVIQWILRVTGSVIYMPCIEIKFLVNRHNKPPAWIPQRELLFSQHFFFFSRDVSITDLKTYK